MVSNAVANSSAPAFLKDSSARKKNTSRLAKLKRSKLDVRREQWLSQVKGKNDEVDSDGTVGSRFPLTRSANSEHQAMEYQRRTKHDDHDDVLSKHSREPVSMMSCSVDSLSSHDCMGKHDPICDNSSGGSFSGCVSEEDGGDGCLDDWEDFADALNAENDTQTPCRDQNPKPLQSVEITDVKPAEDNSVERTVTDGLGFSS